MCPAPAAGCRPQWVQPVVDPLWGIAHGLDPATVATALERAAASGKPVSAVLVVSPTYFGYVSDTLGGRTSAYSPVMTRLVARLILLRMPPLTADIAHAVVGASGLVCELIACCG